MVVVLHYPWKIDLLKLVSLSHEMCGCLLNHLYFVPLSLYVNVFLGTRHARDQTSKSVPMKCPLLPVRPATTAPLPIIVKFPYASPVNPSEQPHCLTQQLKNQLSTGRSVRGTDVIHKEYEVKSRNITEALSLVQ